jgi:hypothetical protein
VKAIEVAFTGNAPPSGDSGPAWRDANGPAQDNVSPEGIGRVFPLNPKTPYQAFKVMEALMATLLIQGHGAILLES